MDKREAYLDWINRYCNTDFYDEYVDEEGDTIPTNIPAGLELIIQDMILINPSGFGITSERAEGLAVTYRQAGLLDSYKLALAPYRKIKSR